MAQTQTLWNSQAADLQVGDLWTSSSDDVVITSVETLPADDCYPNGRISVEGIIVRGYGRSKKVRRWMFHPTQNLDIEREV